VQRGDMNKKFECPVCHEKWYEDDFLRLEISPSQDIFDIKIVRLKIKDFIFCPACFFKAKSKENNECEAKIVILKKENIKIEKIVCLNEFGEYVDLDLKTLKTVESEFFQSDDIDDHTSQWGSDGPDCQPVPEGVRLYF
jgi:hypothetical protein